MRYGFPDDDDRPGWVGPRTSFHDADSGAEPGSSGWMAPGWPAHHHDVGEVDAGGAPARPGLIPSPLALLGEPIANAIEGLRQRWRARKGMRGCAVLGAGARDHDRVRATGEVHALDELLIAPLSGEPCVAYRTWVWPLGSPRTSRLQETAQVQPFRLRFDDREVIVDGIGAVIALRRTREPRAERDPMRALSFLARHGVETDRGVFGEMVLRPGDRVTAAGTLLQLHLAVPPREQTGGYRDAPLPASWIVGTDARPLVLTR